MLAQGRVLAKGRVGSSQAVRQGAATGSVSPGSCFVQSIARHLPPAESATHGVSGHPPPQGNWPDLPPFGEDIILLFGVVVPA